MTEAPWLKGYRHSIAGETIPYHSPYPDSGTALLVRATDGRRAIEWETEPVAPGPDAGQVTFLWMCGLATRKGAHEFTLHVNDSPAVSFRTGRDASETSWQRSGEGGVELRFAATLVDRFAELFGFMWLTLPRSALKAGAPVRLKITGEEAESEDWCMVFEYDLEDRVRVYAEEAWVHPDATRSAAASRPRQLVRVEVSHLDVAREVTITVDEAEPMRAQLATGYNAIHVPVETSDREREIGVRIEINGGSHRPARRHAARVTLRPVEQRDLYLLPHSHLDIGYSDRQQVVEGKHWGYFREAIELARRTREYPPEARFKWNVETLWAVETYLAQASPREREEFLAAVRRGEIGLQALLANELTGICHPEELVHLTAFARRLKREHGLEVSTAMITDIPSYTWSLVPALALSGVTCLSSGPNYMPRLADGGDRVGFALKTWGDRPFYWVSPAGGERLLLWMAGRGYSWFHGLNMGEIGPESKRSILDYLRELAARDYPYRMVQVRYTVGGDNGPPDPNLPDFVKAWNEEFVSPRLVIATSQEMFAEFERRHGSELPEVRGDFTPYWEDGVASSARETALNRRTASVLLQAETLWALLRPREYPAEAFYEAWRQVVLFDEHTWGAAESVSDPDGENSRAQWAWKRAVVLAGARQAAALRGRVLHGDAATPPAPPEDPVPRAGATAPPSATVVVPREGSSTELPSPARCHIEVLNTHAWTRTDLVRMPRELSAEGDRVRDERGSRVPAQRLANGELAFVAREVPGLGSRIYTISAESDAGSAREANAPPAEIARIAPEEGRLENDRIRLAVDPESGAIANLRWRPDDAELVDRASGPGLNAYRYVPGRSPEAARPAAGARLATGEAGPLLASLRIEADAPGCDRLTTELRLVAALDYLEIVNRLEKRRVREKESVHFAFPFLVPGASFLLDLGWAFLRPEIDQLPGSCKDYFCIHNTAELSNGDLGITFASPDVPLIELGQMVDETGAEKGMRAWRERLEPTGTLFSYVMNNYWHTNYKADQEGTVEVTYALRPHGGDGAAAAKRFGLERSQPLVVRAVDEKTRPRPALLAVEPAAVLITSLRPSRDRRAVMATLFNASTGPETVVLSGPLAGRSAIHASNPDEDRGARLGESFPLASSGIRILRIETN